MPPDLTTLPALRAPAEDRAREAHNLFARFTWGVEDGWSELDDDAQATLVHVHLALLADLTRPASRDEIARLVAAKVRVDTSNGVLFCRRTYEQNGRDHRPDGWVILADDDECKHFCEPSSYFAMYGGVVVPGISAITDPADALAAIALAVLR